MEGKASPTDRMVINDLARARNLLREVAHAPSTSSKRVQLRRQADDLVRQLDNAYGWGYWARATGAMDQTGGEVVIPVEKLVDDMPPLLSWQELRSLPPGRYVIVEFGPEVIQVGLKGKLTLETKYMVRPADSPPAETEAVNVAATSRVREIIAAQAQATPAPQYQWLVTLKRDSHPFERLEYVRADTHDIRGAQLRFYRDGHFFKAFNMLEVESWEVTGPKGRRK